MYMCDFCGETKGAAWERSYELQPMGSMKCAECGNIYMSLKIEELDNGDAWLRIPPDMIKSLGWKVGDDLDLKVRGRSVIVKVRE